MDKAVIYIHGKGGNAEEAIHYKPLFSNCDVIGLDYTAQFPWEAKEEFPLFCYQCLIKSANRESIFYFARCRYGKAYC